MEMFKAMARSLNVFLLSMIVLLNRKVTHTNLFCGKMEVNGMKGKLD